MRSPHSYVVVCRLPDGRLAVRESPWRPIWERLRFLRRPFLRGAVVLAESLHNGLDALSFAANQQARAWPVEEGGAPRDDAGAASPSEAPELSGSAIAATLALSVALAFVIFAAIPHALAWLAGGALGLDVREGTSVAFHALDGVIKGALFVAYLWGIARLPDIRRVFMYHGAEHKSIATYEAGQALVVENARAHSRFHPRCGTSFMFLVILLGVVVFSAFFPLVPQLVDNRILNQALYVLIKIPLMFPIAGLAYEAQRLSARAPGHPLVRLVIWPGLALQRITTVEPDDSMLEVALLSLRSVLWREQAGPEAQAEDAGAVRVFDSFDAAAAAVRRPVAAPA